jgi:NADPH:quinone reductase
MGADLVVDHVGDVVAQFRTAGISTVDMVLSTANSAANLPWIAGLLRPFGHISVVDGAAVLDASVLVPKSVSLHTEMIFTRLLNDYAPETHGVMLDQVAAFIATGRIQSILTTRLDGLTPQTMQTAHGLLEKRQTIGKVVIATN